MSRCNIIFAREKRGNDPHPMYNLNLRNASPKAHWSGDWVHHLYHIFTQSDKLKWRKEHTWTALAAASLGIWEPSSEKTFLQKHCGEHHFRLMKHGKFIHRTDMTTHVAWILKLAVMALTSTWLSKARPSELLEPWQHHTQQCSHRISFPNPSSICSIVSWPVIERTYEVSCTLAPEIFYWFTEVI